MELNEVLENKNPGAMFRGLQFNTHHSGHIARAAQEELFIHCIMV